MGVGMMAVVFAGVFVVVVLGGWFVVQSSKGKKG